MITKKIAAIVLSVIAGAALFASGSVVQSRKAELAAAESNLRPIAAIAVTQCGQALALYVVTDPQHMFLFEGTGAHLFTAVPGEKPVESHGPAVPFDAAMKLAQEAPLQSHVAIPCLDSPT